MTAAVPPMSSGPSVSSGSSESSGPSAPMSGRPRLRLALLVLVLVTIGLAVSVGGVISVDQVRGWVEQVGPLAPLVFIPISGVLAALFVPGPVLAGASGLLFGTLIGTIVTIISAVVTSVITLRIGRAAGREGARSMLGAERAEATEKLLERHGLLAVAGQRMAPFVPDAPLSYAFGAFGVKTWQVVLGTLIGAAPRSFSYTAVGATLGDPSTVRGIIAGAVWIAAAVVGSELLRRLWRSSRTREEASPTEETSEASPQGRSDAEA